MRIDLAIHSSDGNPLYLDFWVHVSKMWKEHMGIRPVLIFIDDKYETTPIDETYGTVVRMKPIPGIPVYLQCLWVRYWYPCQHPDKVSILCDIDMFPISKRYFVEQIKDIPDTKYVHLNPLPNYLPTCYHIAKGTLFQQVLQLPTSWEGSIRTLFTSKLGTPLGQLQKWGADEEYAKQKIFAYHDHSVFIMIPRKHGRIDRSLWEYSVTDIQNDVYADAHSIRPYSDPRYKPLIHKLISEIYRYAA